MVLSLHLPLQQKWKRAVPREGNILSSHSRPSSRMSPMALLPTFPALTTTTIAYSDKILFVA